MKKFLKRLYLLGFILALLMGGILFVEYKLFEEKTHKEIEKNIASRLDYMSSETSAYFNWSVQSVKSAELFISAEEDHTKVLYFLEEQLKSTPSFISLYFGTPSNKMYNGSGWIPSDTFDLRTRPWYIDAVATDGFITTSLYLNASKDNWIVTFAKPVYSQKGEFLGVVAGDNSLDSILSTLRNQKISENGYSFFIDQNGKLIMHSGFKSSAPENAEMALISKNLSQVLREKEEGLSLITLNEMEGYLAWTTIDGTGWIIGNFAPLSDFIDVKEQVSELLALIVIVISLIFTVLFIIQKKYLINPLIQINNDILKISVEQEIAYRLPLIEHDPFSDIRLAINKTLTNTQSFFEIMNANREELEASNANLISSQHALVLSESKIRALVSLLPDMLFVYSSEGILIDCLTKSQDFLIPNATDFIGKKMNAFMPKDVAESGETAIKRAILTNELQSFEYSLELPGGRSYYETRMIKSTENEVVAIVRNITESKMYLHEIEKLSYHDQLTGLYNRRFFDEELKRLDTARNLPLTIVMLDVNGLKLTNDAFGHLVGDELLIRVGQIVSEQCRMDEIVARIGGDEFVILLPKTASEDAGKIVQRIYRMISHEKINQIPISLSIGWKSKTDPQESITDIFIKAEDRMYRRKIIESQDMRHRTLQVIVNALNNKSSSELGHSNRVSEISKSIGMALGLNQEMIKEIESIGLLHDIGKITIKKEVLNKPGKLTAMEYEEIKRHPEIGYQILKSVDAYASLAEFVLGHHERWDGNGYPSGLRGNHIPLISRIICVAEAFDAMLSDQSYRKALSLSEALLELKDNAGKQFDSGIIDIVLEMAEDWEL